MLMLSPFLNAQVIGIPEHPSLFTVQQFIGGYDVVGVGVGVGGRSVDAVNQPECVVDTNVHLHAEVLLLPFLVWCISGGPPMRSRWPLSFLVELGAEMMLASIMLPSRSIKLFFSIYLFTSLNDTLPRPWRFRK